ncbi:F0F1 ATP synthase subunit B family protein [Salinarimonas soli]|uniref:ATP synthase subunit b n=1 Tax=Salinarimonas soli TaxID=1638099 RepID=A0A5B2VD22_9HYPH|nr:F0F1 ATP synthase subunit B' [Salinarimonas soli]KAA2236219.1 F0F1 ATP synthase subunit B' [Salinarimonas soli]
MATQSTHTGVDATAHTSAADPSHSASFPPFDASTFGGQLFWLAVVFVALYLLMSRVVLPRLSGIIEARDTTLGRDLDTAARAKQQAEDAGRAYEASLAEARARAQSLAQQTRDSLAADTDVKRKALEADLAERIAASEVTIAERKAQAMSNVRDIAADAATAIVERLTGQAPAPQAVAAALDAPTR